ncbi:flagellar motor protein MotB [Virgibacillus litoralis]|uniref:Chemotaxis protein MotB n=1 Tax=Virgibacillus litoralis TaxID=578221 RepID=A0ABS4HFY3_9BACI|nr:flagellar motor protein MotB [Virgibacillus litoralis]MBP1949820.1 chemotaxis protein MotB [Virgibacillus litoralis]
MRRKKKSDEIHMSESWLLPYADLLTLLLALFIVLFAMSEIDAKKYEELSRVFNSEFSGGEGILEESNSSVEMPQDVEEDEEETEKPEDEEKLSNSEQELNRLELLQKRINEYITENNLAEKLGTKLTGEGLLITIINDVTFDSGSAVVRGEGRGIASAISTFLYTDPPHQIIVSGHTDDRPIRTSEFSSNWDLSVMRAVNFMRLILENEKLDPKTFSAKGFGEHKPMVPNTNDQNRAKNRRVEVLILPNYDIKEEL